MQSQKQKGFSLIELSVAVSVAAIAAVGFLTWATPTARTDAQKAAETRKEIKVIADILESYRVEKKRLPCPADPYMRQDNNRASGGPADAHVNNFGVEDFDTTQGDSSDGINCPTTVGMIPIRTLGIDYNYAEDAWGRRYTYHISSKICGTQGCSQNDYENETGGSDITVSDGSSNLTTTAAYVIVSHGADGLGAFMPSGKKIANGTGNQLENHDSDITYVKAEHSNTFDDLVFFKTRTQIEAHTTDTITKMVGVEFCNNNSVELEKITAAVATDMNNDISILGASNGAHKVLSLLWSLQSTCAQYYGITQAQYDQVAGWDGPKCPGGANSGAIFKYDATTNQSWCECHNGKWNGNCIN